MGHGVASSTICLNKAKFHYTGPTGPDRTRTDFFCGPGFRETPLGPCGSPTKSVRVRSGPVGPVLWNLAFIGGRVVDDLSA